MIRSNPMEVMEQNHMRKTFQILETCGELIEHLGDTWSTDATDRLNRHIPQISEWAVDATDRMVDDLQELTLLVDNSCVVTAVRIRCMRTFSHSSRETVSIICLVQGSSFSESAIRRYSSCCD